MDAPKPRKAFTSAKQVAELAGVSRSAVSRTFTPGASVSDETRRRVLLASEQLGYHVNHLARGLLSRSSGIVCLVSADSHTPYTSRLVRTLTQHLQDAGKVVMLLDTSSSRSSLEHVLRQTLNYRADATVVLSGTPPQSIIRTCLDNGQRMILINRDDRLAGPCNLALDDAAAARTAYDAFAAAGCLRPAVVTSRAGTPSLVARERAFVRQAEAAGRPVVLARNGKTSYDAGVAGARDLLASAERPDAAFCVTDLIACGFMDAARYEFGLRIPEDLCVIGFDDIDQAGWAAYGLTTFMPPLSELADAVVRIVSSKGEVQPDRRVFEASIRWRDTVRRP